MEGVEEETEEEIEDEAGDAKVFYTKKRPEAFRKSLARKGFV